MTHPPGPPCDPSAGAGGVEKVSLAVDGQSSKREHPRQPGFTPIPRSIVRWSDCTYSSSTRPSKSKLETADTFEIAPWRKAISRDRCASNVDVEIEPLVGKASRKPHGDESGTFAFGATRRAGTLGFVAACRDEAPHPVKPDRPDERRRRAVFVELTTGGREGKGDAVSAPDAGQRGRRGGGQRPSQSNRDDGAAETQS